MISDTITDDILQRLRHTGQTHQVRVLYAVESGSRAWGVASPDSPRDVRFVYAHPRDGYLCVEPQPHPDEITDGTGLHGRDLRTALALFRQSDPSVVEWLHSPLVYHDDGRFAARARALLPQVYAVEKGVRHYLDMAQSHYRGYLKAQLVPLKEYFCVLRPLLAIRWLERYRTPPPVEFELLGELVENAAVRKDIARLLVRKAHSPEKQFVPVVAGLNGFIENELSRFARSVPAPIQDPAPVRDDATEAVNDLFRACLAPASG